MSKKGSLATNSEGSKSFNFDGIFRDVNDENTRTRLYKAQGCVKDNAWDIAKNILKDTILSLSEGHDKRNLELVLKEIERYQRCLIDPSIQPAAEINWNNVFSRKPEMHFEKYDDLPQSMFMLKFWKLTTAESSGRVLVGRRLLSHQWIANKIRELHCSLIHASMLLGLMIGHRVQENGVCVYYYPLNDQEKKFIMHDTISNRLKDVEIVYPYPPLQTTLKTEIHSPDEGWEIDEKFALQLGEGEVLLRDYSIQHLKSLEKEDLYLFDPACSTGQFLKTMQTAFPKSFTFGQDLSPCMAKYASHRVDEALCANANDPQIPDETADVSFVRFINSEVVTNAEARSMIRPLLKPIKKGGHMVIFGHTPVLVTAADLQMHDDIVIEQCVGGDSKYDGVFQYYVVKKV